MSDEQLARESEIFDQELSLDDLDAAAGGSVTYVEAGESDSNNCTVEVYRNPNGGNGYPNCANTVTYNVECNESDACKHCAIFYEN